MLLDSFCWELAQNLNNSYKIYPLDLDMEAAMYDGFLGGDRDFTEELWK